MNKQRNSSRTYEHNGLKNNAHIPLLRVGPKQTVFTPFRDDIWNRRQVSVGDRGVLST